jgi:hypothetical protein
MPIVSNPAEYALIFRIIARFEPHDSDRLLIKVTYIERYIDSSIWIQEIMAAKRKRREAMMTAVLWLHSFRAVSRSPLCLSCTG